MDVTVLSINMKRGWSLDGVLTRGRFRLLPPDRIAIPVDKDCGWPDHFLFDVALQDWHRADATRLARAPPRGHLAAARRQRPGCEPSTERSSETFNGAHEYAPLGRQDKNDAGMYRYRGPPYLVIVN